MALISRQNLGLTHPCPRSGHVQENPVRVVDPVAKIVVPMIVPVVEMKVAVVVVVCHWS